MVLKERSAAGRWKAFNGKLFKKGGKKGSRIYGVLFKGCSMAVSLILAIGLIVQLQ